MASTASTVRNRKFFSGKTFEECAVALDQFLAMRAGFVRIDHRTHGRNDDRTAFVHRHIDRVSNIQPRQLPERGIEYQSLGIAHFRDFLEHGLFHKTMYYVKCSRAEWEGQGNQGQSIVL